MYCKIELLHVSRITWLYYNEVYRQHGLRIGSYSEFQDIVID